MNRQGVHASLVWLTYWGLSIVATVAYAGMRYPDDPAGARQFRGAARETAEQDIARIRSSVRDAGVDAVVVSNLIQQLASFERTPLEGGSGDVLVAGLAVRQLRETGEGAVPLLIDATACPNARVREHALALVYMFFESTRRESEVMPVIVRSLDDINVEVRKTAVSACALACERLAKRREFDAASVYFGRLVRALQDPDDSVRQRAAVWLYDFGRPELVPEAIRAKFSAVGFVSVRPRPLPESVTLPAGREHQRVGKDVGNGAGQ
jgi:hypothetical protein